MGIPFVAVYFHLLRSFPALPKVAIISLCYYLVAAPRVRDGSLFPKSDSKQLANLQRLTHMVSERTYSLRSCVLKYFEALFTDGIFKS